jgi:hypothetical protein
VAKTQVEDHGRVYPVTPYCGVRGRIAAMLKMPACVLEEHFPRAAQVCERAQERVLRWRRWVEEEERREEEYRTPA